MLIGADYKIAFKIIGARSSGGLMLELFHNEINALTVC